MMITHEQEQIIDEYVNEEYFDRDRIKRYLAVHDSVGNEIFSYCDKKKSPRGDHSYTRYLDDDYGFHPVDIDTFIRRVPFYFYVSPEDIKVYGSLEYVLYSVIKKDHAEKAELEEVYQELEYLFYDMKLPLVKIFSYIIDQFGVVTAPFLQWADYIHICSELGWTDYYPDSFISKYNYALEAVGREPIIYEVEIDPYISELYFRNGKKITFDGTFPKDENGAPVLRWTNLMIKDAEAVKCTGEKSKRGHIEITIKPTTIIYGKNFFDSWDKDEWYQVYAGPLKMELSYMVIKSRRKALNYTQQEVADAIGASLRTYQKWEGGETKPDGHYLLRLMNWLDIVDPQTITEFHD